LAFAAAGEIPLSHLRATSWRCHPLRAVAGGTMVRPSRKKLAEGVCVFGEGFTVRHPGGDDTAHADRAGCGRRDFPRAHIQVSGVRPHRFARRPRSVVFFQGRWGNGQRQLPKKTKVEWRQGNGTAEYFDPTGSHPFGVGCTSPVGLLHHAVARGRCERGGR